MLDRALLLHGERGRRDGEEVAVDAASWPPLLGVGLAGGRHATFEDLIGEVEL